MPSRIGSWCKMSENTMPMMTMVSAALGPDITVGVLLKTAVKRQLRMAALIPITTAWGMKSLPRAEKAVIP